MLILGLFPLRECVVVLAGVKAMVLRVAAPALTPAAGVDVGRLRGTAAGLVFGSAGLVCLLKDLARKTRAGVEDLDADEVLVVPVEGDEGVDAFGRRGPGGAACVAGAAEVDVGGVGVGVVADPHVVIVPACSATSWR